MDIVRLDTKTLVELLKVLLLLIFVAAAGVVVSLFDAFERLLLSLSAVDVVKFVDFVLTKEREVVLASLVVDAIEVSKRTIAADDVGVTKKAPHLSQSH